MATDPNAAIYDAIRQADAAGDSASVARLAAYLKESQGAAPENDATPADGGPTAVKDPATGRWVLDPGANPPAEQPKPPASTLDQIKYGLGVGTRDVLGGAGQLANFVQSPISAIWNGLGGKSADYEELADKLADHIGLPRGADDDHLGKAFRRGAVAGILTAGAAAPLAGAEGATGALASALSDAPIVNAASSGASAASSEGAKDAGAGPIGQFAAGLAGGGLTAAGMIGAPALARSGANAARSIAAPFTSAGAADQAASILARSRTLTPDQIAENFANAPVSVEGVQPTLAEVAQDPGLAGLQRGHANTDPNTAAAIHERHSSNMLARNEAVQGSLGDGQAQAVQDYGAGQVEQAGRATEAQQGQRQAAVDQRVSASRAAATAGRATAENRLRGSIEALGDTADRDATGASAREAFDNAYATAKQRSNEAYSAPVLKTPQPVKIADSFFKQMRGTLDDFYGDGGGYVPEKLKTILDDSAADGATTRTLTNIDRRLADFAGASRMTGNNADAGVAERIRGDLASFVQKATPPEYRDALKAAKAVRAEQGRVFETGAAPAAFGRDRYNNPSVGNTELPTKLLRPGPAGGDTADGLIAAIGPQAAESVVRQEIRRAAEERGIQTAQQARQFSIRYAEAARRFPAVQQDLRAIETHAGNADLARQTETDALRAGSTPEEDAHVRELSSLQEQIDKTPLARVADANTDPTAFVGQLLRKDDAGRQFKFLARQVSGNPEATSGLRRALGDYISSKGAGPNFTASGDRIPSINNTRKAIATVVDRAGDTLTPQQKIVLKKVSRELEAANFAATASKPAGSETAINKTFSELTNIPLIRHVPVVGRPVKFILDHVVSALGNKDEVKELITKSILDPDFAMTLLKRPTPQHWEQIKAGLIAQKTASSVLHPSLQPVAQFLDAPSLAAQSQPQQDRR